MMSSYFIVFNIRTVSFGLQTREGKHAAHPGTWSSDRLPCPLCADRCTASPYHRHIKIDGMLLTLVDSRTNLAKSTVEALRANFGNQIRMYRTQIPIAVKAAETSSKGKSIYAYEPNSTVSKAYAEFTKEVLADGRKKERLHSHEAR